MAGDPQRDKIRREALRTWEELLAACQWPPESRADAIQRFNQWVDDDLIFREALEVVPLIIEDFSRTADCMMALRNWDRYQHAVFNRQALYHLVLSNRSHLQLLAKLFAFSQFFSDIVIRNPEYLDWALSEAILDREKLLEEYRQQLDGFVRAFKNPESRRRALCRFKRRELLRLGIRGILGKSTMAGQCLELSRLAEVACELAHDDSRPLLVEKHGEPERSTGNAIASGSGFAVVAMGKFGGEELNFSSDIDLVFVYDSEGWTTGKTDSQGHVSGRISNHEFFCKLGAAITQYLSYPTTEGVLYRVDTRLRPEGASGAAARSLAGYNMYFVQQAREWEKLPYVKARVVAGDRSLEAPFIERCHSFIYGGSDPTVLLLEVARLKQRIDYERLDAEGRALDIKRGPGGIREIEFIVVALQLLHGVHDKRFRVRETLTALELLEESGHVPQDDARILRDAYWFYRSVEHTLQMMEEQQTHALPKTEEQRRALAIRCGFNDVHEFERILADYRRYVRNRFEELFLANDATARLTLADKITTREAPDADTLAELATYGLGTVEGYHALRELAAGSREMAVSSTGQRYFEQLLPRLLDEVKCAAMPVLAIRHLGSLMRSHRSVAMLYDLMLAHPPVLRLLVRILGFGMLPARSMVAHPEYLDEMLETDALSQQRSLHSIAQAQLHHTQINSADEALKRLRKWKNAEEIYLAAREILQIHDSREAAQQTAELAEICLDEVGHIVWSEPIADAPWCILALGGFGAREVHLSSDLDIAFFFDPTIAGDAETKQRVERTAGAIIAAMTAVTPEGTLWKVDARLRPDGRNAPLIVTLDRAHNYYTREANIWEFQSVTRARFVSGNAALGERVLGLLRDAYRARYPFENLAAEIRSMRARLEEATKMPRHVKLDLKRSPGGIVDVEFLVQYVQLSHGIHYPQLLTPEMDDAIARIAGLDIIPSEDIAFIRAHYRTLRAIQRILRLLWETPRDYVTSGDEKQDQLARALDCASIGSNTLKELPVAMNTMREIFQKYLNNWA